MATYHSFKPVKMYEKEMESSEFYKCKDKEWVTVIPIIKYRFTIMLESDYPREIFGAPKYYAMYGTWKGKNILIGAGNSREELGENILRFAANECFWNNLGRHAYKAYQEWMDRFKN